MDIEESRREENEGIRSIMGLADGDVCNESAGKTDERITGQ